MFHANDSKLPAIVIKLALLLSPMNYTQKYSISSYKNLLLMLLVFFNFVGQLQAQQHVPQQHENKPLSLDSPATIIVFVVIPVLAILLYVVLKKVKKSQDRKQK